MDYILFELAASAHVEKFKKVIEELPLHQKSTYMNVAADIPISEFYLIADEIRVNNNIGINEEYKTVINALISDITFDLFEYCRTIN